MILTQAQYDDAMAVLRANPPRGRLDYYKTVGGRVECCSMGQLALAAGAPLSDLGFGAMFLDRSDVNAAIGARYGITDSLVRSQIVVANDGTSDPQERIAAVGDILRPYVATS